MNYVTLFKVTYWSTSKSSDWCKTTKLLRFRCLLEVGIFAVTCIMQNTTSCTKAHGTCRNTGTVLLCFNQSREMLIFQHNTLPRQSAINAVTLVIVSHRYTHRINTFIKHRSISHLSIIKLSPQPIKVQSTLDQSIMFWFYLFRGLTLFSESQSVVTRALMPDWNFFNYTSSRAHETDYKTSLMISAISKI